MSIIPSRPMFTTPLRSEYIPQIPANTSGVEKTSIDAISDAEKTLLRFSLPERVARIPSPIPIAERTQRPPPVPRRTAAPPREPARAPLPRPHPDRGAHHAAEDRPEDRPRLDRGEPEK